ncbi:hypothetical protein U1872_07925 [Sphingomonas sp. RB3P16]|uniref:hypothetical protein n=1 Tax=Parasphingomonas frigoris TaxID=3096163 RepID=UPI002FCBADF8
MSVIVGTALTFALAQSAVESAPGPPPAAPLALVNRSACAPSSSGEIVVCGKRDTEQYRLRPLPPLPENKGFLTKPMDVKIGPIHWHGLSATVAF